MLIKDSFKKENLPDLHLNIYIKTLAFTDSFVWFGYFFFFSIVAIHIDDRLGVDAIQAIAIGSSIYLIVRGLVQFPVTHYLDSNESEKDEIYAIFLGGLLMSVSFLGYYLVYSDISLYLINVIFGLGVGTYLPAYRKVYGRYVDPKHDGAHYAFNDFLLTTSGALAAIAGGYLVATTGSYLLLFLTSAFFTLTGAFIVLKISNDVKA